MGSAAESQNASTICACHVGVLPWLQQSASTEGQEALSGL